MINDRYEIIRQIDEGGISEVYLGYDHILHTEVAVRMLKKEMLSTHIEDIIRFRNEAALLSRLDHPNIVKIFEAFEYREKQYIIMEYISGRSLYKIIKAGEVLAEDTVIEIILEVCRALDYIHQQNIVHRDLKPGNIMVYGDEKNKRHIKVIDFGLALIKEFAAVKDLEEIVGTFCYMSPEHFRVTNKSVDERSDLYSLGVIFYQLITGVLPFEGMSTGSIIHQQIARTPVPPSEHNKFISETLERIIRKLLEKQPGMRYQSARGLMHDLEKYKKGERKFSLGMNDKQIRLSFVTKMIARDREWEILNKLYAETRNGRGAVCLISGEAGKGKTRLAEELRSVIFGQRGLFLNGKCFSGKSKMPYGPFKDALNVYTAIYQDYTEDKKTEVRDKLREMTGDLCAIVLQLNPALAVIFENCPKPVKLESEREKKRFLMVAVQFLLNLSLVENGLVLFLDDLQWADDGSMDLLAEFGEELHRYPLFILGTYRNDEINKEHRLNEFKSRAERGQYGFREIYLEPFSSGMVYEFVKSLLYSKEEDITAVTEMIYQKSKGNPFFAKEILKQFVAEKVIYYEKQAWQTNKEKLNTAEIAPTIVDIVMKRISWLAEEEVKVLSYAAVIGRKFDVEILFRLLDVKAGEIIHIVDRAIKLQLLEEDPQDRRKLFFVHDRIKEAFYRKIGEDKRKLLHNMIATTMEQIYMGDTRKVIFDLAYHYIEGEVEDKILEYGYPAGVNAKEHYAYEEALRYFSLIIEILESREERGKNLWVSTNRNISEIYLIIGKNDKAIDGSRKILPFMKSRIQKADILRQICTAYFNKGDWLRCEEYGKNGLDLLGENLPVSKGGAILRIAKEFIIHILHGIVPHIFETRREAESNKKYKLILSFHVTLNWMYILNDLLKFVGSTLRLLNLAESKIGKSVELGVGLAGYASICMAIPLFKRAIRLHEKAFGLRKELNDEWGMAQSLQFLGFCYQWKGEYGKSLRCFSQSLEIFTKIGDLWEIKMALSGLDMSYFYASNYEKSLEYNSRYMKVCEHLNDNFGKSGALADYAFIRYHKGEYSTALKYTEESLSIAAQNKITLIHCIAYILMGILHNELAQYKKGIEYLEKACSLYEHNNLLEYYTAYVYSYLADGYISEIVDSYADVIRLKQGEINKIGKLCAKALGKTRPWKIHYAHALRVYARYNILLTKNKKAERLILQSIDLSRKLGFKYELGRSLYEYGKFLLGMGKIAAAKRNLESAYYVFTEIDSKVYGHKVAKLLGIDENSDNVGIASIKRLKDQERLASIIQVSRNISSILFLDLLLKNIISLAMETTGARRGYLFIYENEKNKLELKIKKGIHEEETTPAISEQKEHYSGNIVETVFKTGKALLLTDAEKNADYAKYDSVVQYGIKSVLCVPIRRQSAVIGVCYLDNPLTSAVFSAEDTQILEAMMTQAAISIENAQLYEKMKQMKDKAESEVEKLTIHISRKQEKFLDGKNSLVYQSGKMQETVERVNQAIRVTKPVLITGETGTGKELIAKLIHYSGNHKQKPFITINCAAIPHTLWEAELFGHLKGSFTDAKSDREGSIKTAGTGTLFFDEIGEMPLEIQSKLLRLLQENQYRPIGSNKTYNAECRFVFSTNRNVEQMIKEGTFREDLYYRINVFRINVAPLRERADDIPILLDYFLEKYSREFELPPNIDVEKQAMEKIVEYNWPGNIRELENFIIRSLAALSSSNGSKNILRLSHLPFILGIALNQDDTPGEQKPPENKNEILVNGNYEEIVHQYAKELVQWALKKAEGNKTAAARILGIKRTSLYYKMKEFHLE